MPLWKQLAPLIWKSDFQALVWVGNNLRTPDPGNDFQRKLIWPLLVSFLCFFLPYFPDIEKPLLFFVAEISFLPLGFLPSNSLYSLGSSSAALYEVEPCRILASPQASWREKMPPEVAMKCHLYSLLTIVANKQKHSLLVFWSFYLLSNVQSSPNYYISLRVLFLCPWGCGLYGLKPLAVLWRY